MLGTIYRGLQRVVWLVQPVSPVPSIRDHTLIDRAAWLLDHGSDWQTVAAQLVGHSMPQHALRALMRDRKGEAVTA